MDLLSPFHPTPDRPWDLAAVAHLTRRAGFAASMAELEARTRLSCAEAVDELVDGADQSGRHDELDGLGPRLAQRNDIAVLRGWWLLRMRHTARPLHARMAVFWHDHFATSNVKVSSAPMMYAQLRTFERLGMGPFGDLLRAVARDPAMIVWLDGEANVKGRPNENFARELFELFTLGVGHYQERDIQEAARAFTGWHQKAGRFKFLSREHDAGPKTVFEQRGEHDGDDVIELALAQPACGPFLARRLLQAFLTPEPPDDLVESVAARLRESSFHIGETLRTVLGSRIMFEPRWRGVRIKSPVEYAIGLARSLDLQVNAPELADAVSRMGQRLFEPPSVEGWDGHRSWLDSATLLVRLNVASQVVGGDRIDPGSLIDRYALSDRELVRAFCERLTMSGPAPPALRQRLDQIDGDGPELMRGALKLLLSSPEYQMA